MSSSSSQDIYAETLAAFEQGPDPHEPLTTPEVADVLGEKRRTVYKRLQTLAERGDLRTKKAGSHARVWWRADVPREAPAVSTPDASNSETPDASNSATPDVPISTGHAGALFVGDVLDEAQVGVLILDSDFEVLWINDATEQYFGIDRATVIGRDKRRLVRETISDAIEDSEQFTETVLATYDDNTYTEEFECRVTPGAGREERWLEHRSKPIESGPYAGGRIEVYYDVTDRKQTRQALRSERERFQSLVQNVEEYAIFELDADGYVQSWNSGAERIKGYDEDEIVGEHFSTFYTDEDRDAGVPGANLERAAEEGSTEDEGWRVRADGSKFWANVTLTAIRDDDGELEGYAKVTRDMTERREREQAVRRERNLLDQVLEASPVGIGVFDSRGGPRRVNQRFTDLLGLSESDPNEYALGDQPLLDEDGDVIPYPERPAPLALETGEPVTDRRIRVDGTDGRTRWLSVNAEPFGDADGVVVTTADVTQLEEQARRLERQRDEVESELDEVFERLDDGFFALDRDLQFTYVNECASDLLDQQPTELVGRYIWDAFDPGPKAERGFDEALDAQTPVSFEEFYEPLETWFEVHVYPSDTGLSVYFRDVTDRKERERELETQREQLAALNNLNDIFRGITEAVIDQSTREEIEQTVCERLANTDSYSFAWVGDVDGRSETVNLRMEAGVEGYLDGVTISTDPDDERGDGPTGRAIRRREMQTTHDVRDDDRFDPWRDHVREHGFRSSAAIPITHEDTLYGVLNVYADRPEAFTGDEAEVISQLGEVVGHAIAAVERKQALLSDEIVELEFHIPDVFAPLDVPTSVDGTISFERAIPVGDDSYLVYGTLTGGELDAVETVVDVDAVPHWESVNVLGTDGDTVHFELQLDDPPVLSTVTAYGGYVDEATLEDGDYYVKIHLTPSAKVRDVIDVIRESYPAAEMVTRRQVTRSRQSPHHVVQVLSNRLTDRQQAALEAGYFSGFFDWPRESSGEDVADSLGIKAPTFHQHIRKAEKKLLDVIFSEN